MKSCLLAICMSLFLIVGAAPANALLIGGPDIIAAPGSVIDDAPGAENYYQQAFDEAQDVYLTRDIAVDGGTLLEGLWVDSHMIFLNTPDHSLARDRQTWVFDAPIIGVMSDYSGSLETASNDLLGAPGTFYPGSFPARGMEGADSYTISGNSIEVFMAVTEPGDWIRVVTEQQPIPEPGTILMMGVGLASLVGLRRKSRK